MTATKRRTFSLAEEHSAFIDERIASGAYASPSDVVGAGLSALHERDTAVELWLREEVAPAYDALKADPSSAIPAETVFQELRERLRSTKPA